METTARGGTGHLPANERKALREYRAAKKLAAEKGLPPPPKPEWAGPPSVEEAEEKNFGGTGHLPASERQLRRQKRAADKEKARAMSDNEGAEPTLQETLSAIAKTLARMDARVAALEKK
jgi:hypothetical protein